MVDQELIETSTQILQAIGATFVPMEDGEDEVPIIEPVIVKPVPTRPQPDRPMIAVSPLVKPAAAESPKRQPIVEQPLLRAEQVHQQQPLQPVAASTEPVAQQPVFVPKAPVTPVQVPKAEPVPVPAREPMQPAFVPKAQVAPVHVPKPVEPVQPSALPRDNSPANNPVPAPVPKAAPQPIGPPAAKPAASVPQPAPPAGPPKMSALAMARLKREQEQQVEGKAGTQVPAPALSVGNPFGKPQASPFGDRPSSQ